ncbi:phosphopantetheinyl transferase [Metarhizium album ARSEF 1941]|uniref:holo-[acyl-carrier-protein] synthase n=1 Tax=Metarhizium album (strain ARSEF 1941) TaxID=1081103 RepID=A0A0B2WEM1_METAS|nr:phosphopantetheinyl transferase [Metarhizium album ARSEF 1941]KHN94276.1 phosphopantetheinyl transferase [Metarhizium album ARSEF 1941]
MSDALVLKWILDTRPLWPEAKATKDLETAASRALSLLTADERASVLRYHFVKDAKLALGSALLKRHAISSALGVPFSRATPTPGPPPGRKPLFRRPDGTQPLAFNVSHQAGLVALAAVRGDADGGADVGVDVVCPRERRERDHALLGRDGWPAYVGMHESVFAAAECERLRDLGRRRGPDEALEYFYALWCLREAWVKMTGEALLAGWLGELEMRNFAPPGAAAAADAPPLEVWFRGRRVGGGGGGGGGVYVRLERYLADYMVCTVVRGDVGRRLGDGFESVDLDALLDSAEKSSL